MRARIGRLLLRLARALATRGFQLCGWDMHDMVVFMIPQETPAVLERRRLQRIAECEKLALALDERYERESALRAGERSGVNWKDWGLN